MQSDKFEHILQQRFKKAEIKPRPELWNQLERKIQEDKRKRRGLFFFLFADFCVLLAIAFSFIAIPSSSPYQTSQTPTYTETIASAEQPIVSDENESPSAEDEAPQTLPEAAPSTDASNGGVIEYIQAAANKFEELTQPAPVPNKYPSTPTNVQRPLSQPTETAKPQHERIAEAITEFLSPPTQDAPKGRNLRVAEDEQASEAALDETLELKATPIPAPAKVDSTDQKIETAPDKLVPQKSDSVVEVISVAPVNSKDLLYPNATPDLLVEEEVVAQSSKSDQVWAFGVNMNPQYTYRVLSTRRNGGNNIMEAPDPPDGFTAASADQVISYANSVESPQLTLSGGLNAELKLSKRIGIQSGVWITSYAESVTYNPDIEQELGFIAKNTEEIFIANQQNGPTVSANDIDASQETSASTRITYMQLPILFNYTIGKGKSGFTFSQGISYNYLLNTGNKNLDYDLQRFVSTGSTLAQPLQKHTVNLVAKGLYQLEAGKYVGFYGGPAFNYSLSPSYIENTGVKKHPFGFGFEVGIKLYVK